VQVEGGIAEDLTVTAVSGDGVKVFTSPSTTVLRDTVVVSEGGGSSGDALLLVEGSGSSPSLAVRNVTTIANTDKAVRCQVSSGHVATLANVIARGGTQDVDATGGAGCTASHSNLRPGDVAGAGDRRGHAVFRPDAGRRHAAAA
jgi:hypothetical protein